MHTFDNFNVCKYLHEVCDEREQNAGVRARFLLLLSAFVVKFKISACAGLILCSTARTRKWRGSFVCHRSQKNALTSLTFFSLISIVRRTNFDDSAIRSNSSFLIIIVKTVIKCIVFVIKIIHASFTQPKVHFPTTSKQRHEEEDTLVPPALRHGGIINIAIEPCLVRCFVFSCSFHFLFH